MGEVGGFRLRRVSVVITAVVLLSLAACGSSSKSDTAGSGSSTTTPAKTRPHVTIDAFDYGFKLPAQMPAGWVDVTLHDSGKASHQIAFAKLGSTTLAAF